METLSAQVGAVTGWQHGAAPDRYPAARKMTSLEDRGCEIGVLADQAMPLIPGS